jgi:hypothetical protein
MAKVDFLASERHYVDHLLPVYAKLPEEVRGDFITGRWPVNPGRITVVSSFGDYRRAEGPVVFMEHGAGFSYGNGHTSYAGSPDREKVVLFASTNEQVDSLNRAAHPNKKHVIVGAPKLDAWVARGPKEREHRPTVAFSFHWDCRVAPETRSAFPVYSDELQRMLKFPGKLQWDVIGHGHPRLWPNISRFWQRNKVRGEKEFYDVVTLSDVYVIDTSSTMYEFAALDRPVVVLNAPFYRKNVNHGIRFWNHVPGIQVDNPKDLKAAIDEAVFRDTFAAERKAATEFVYPYLGQATDRAAQAILELL